MSDMDWDEDKENFMPGYAREKNSGVMQNLNDVNDIISISSDSVNDSSDSDKNEIDIRGIWDSNANLLLFRGD